ncbi:FxLYD domain-containing protein [Halosimplex carlsbadense]|uniref:FxLYD domain-containing protein n=1 Tax=Halosimplex carlsbadense TaxID=171164 RepID=UPI00373AEBAB
MSRTTALDYIEVIAQAWNDTGAIIGTVWTNFTEISAGGSVSFEQESITNGRNGAVSDYSVVLTT